MRNALRIAVTLQRADVEETRMVLLPSNTLGQLPVVLVNPLDVAGQIVPGMWLGDGVGGVGGSVYTWTQESRDFTARQRSGSTVSAELSG